MGIGFAVAFLVIGAVAIVSALMVTFHRNPVIEALSLVINLLAIAGLFILLGAHFMAVLQVIIYAGAIVVLITFVVMLLNLGPEARGGPGLITLLLAFGLGTLLIALLGRAGLTFEPPMTPEGLPATAARYGTVGSFAKVLFTDYFYPFELVSLAIVAALAGAVILAKRNLED